MTTDTIIFIAASLLIFIISWKIFKALFKALVLAILVTTALYFVLPYLTEVEGPVGENAKKAQQTINEVKDKAEEIIEKVKDTSQKVKEGTRQAVENAERAGERLKKAAKAATQDKDSRKNGNAPQPPKETLKSKVEKNESQ